MMHVKLASAHHQNNNSSKRNKMASIESAINYTTLAAKEVKFAPHNQKLVGCKHGTGNILDAKMHWGNLEISRDQSQYCNQHKS